MPTPPPLSPIPDHPRSGRRERSATSAGRAGGGAADAEAAVLREGVPQILCEPRERCSPLRECADEAGGGFWRDEYLGPCADAAKKQLPKNKTTVKPLIRTSASESPHRAKIRTCERGREGGSSATTEISPTTVSLRYHHIPPTTISRAPPPHPQRNGAAVSAGELEAHRLDDEPHPTTS